MKMVRLTESQAIEFCGENTLSARAQSLLGGPLTAIETVGENSAAKIRHILHQLETKTADSSRDPLGDSQPRIFAGSSNRPPQLEMDFFFRNPNLGSTAFFSDCSVCVVKPHAVLAGNTGYVISRLMNEGFEISALQMFSLDKNAASEFLEVYQTILPEYNAIVEQMQSGPCIAMEVRTNERPVESLREICGPHDPAIAKVIRPNTIRAEIGENKNTNGVHCTDLPEDGALESEFFFSVLQRS